MMTSYEPIDAARAALARRVVFGCAIVAFLDGFDTQAIGPAIPAIASQLGLKPDAMGSVLGASQIGFLIGAFLFGALGDRLGRKKMLLLTTALFALGTLATALSGSLPALLLSRVVTGLGLGGASPNFVSLVGEFTPEERRARAVTMLWAAVPLGGMVGAFATGQLLPVHGWHAIFLIGAAAPLPVLAAVALLFPESREVAQERAAPVTALFAKDIRTTTLLLWVTSFMTWSTVVVTALWMPALLQRAGWAAPHAASMLALNNGGGIIGTLAVGLMIGRGDAKRALMATLAAAGCLIALMGAFTAIPFAFAVLAITAGCATSAAGGTLLAVSAGTYVPSARSTGIGWALGVGRTGTVLGPLAVGVMLGLGASVALTFATIAMLALLGVLAAIGLARSARPTPFPHGV
ncbi:MFS transporter [Sphingomonas sp. PR090111-T3T-6A]|uniref:MFS transporter n=1 Tax=Sphingomonas sp. PR090111-T3T-6A TaxID=685778 RepID=UPI000372D14D|nr:MFS transporter [Sphingomonas sp. PR090111-T3T-6A]